jgi:2-polyprenyl-3-methyl-5-hydroxy-6-metoxy-1,4-benzoquinol methylase
MESVNCNLCGSTLAVEIYKVSDYQMDRNRVTARIVRCQNCGLVYQNPRPSLSEISVHYPPESEFYCENPSADAPALLRRVITLGLDKRSALVNRWKPMGRLLDIGCSVGLFLENMASRPGWQVMGVEPSSIAANIAHKHGLDVFTGTLQQASFPNDSFDVVTMWDVLEHLHDPIASLVEIRRILNTNGVLVVRVPNLDSWNARVFGQYWAGLDAPRHLYVFSEDTLQRLLTKAGFRVLETTCQIGGYLPTWRLSALFWLTGHNVHPDTRAWFSRFLGHPLTTLLTGPLLFPTTLANRGPQISMVAAAA